MLLCCSLQEELFTLKIVRRGKYCSPVYVSDFLQLNFVLSVHPSGYTSILFFIMTAFALQHNMF